MKHNLSLSVISAAISIIGLNVCGFDYGFADELPNLPTFNALPANADPNKCYARVLIPAAYKDNPTRVVTQNSYPNYETIDPKFKSHAETVVTRDGYTRYIVTEPTFRTEQIKITTRPSYDKLVAKPAQFNEETETVTIREPNMVWRRGNNLSGVSRIDQKSGDIYYLVEEKAKTQTITRKIIVKPSYIERVTVPAQVKTINRYILEKSASVKEVAVPQETQTVMIDEIEAPAMARKVIEPEHITIVNHQEMVTPEHHEWVEVECNSVVSPQAAKAENNIPAQPSNRQVPPQVTGVVKAAKAASVNMPSATVAESSFEVKIAPQALETMKKTEILKKTDYSVSALQNELGKRGFYRGPLDGVYGTRTRQAVVKFQKAQGFEANGFVDKKVADALGLSGI